MGFDPKVYRMACKEYTRKWALVDRVLYNLRRAHPGHSDPLEVAAKLWIVGRTYAAGIERQLKAGGTQGSSLPKVRDFIIQSHKDVAQITSSLKDVREPLSIDSLSMIVQQHGAFIRLLEAIDGLDGTPRSFVSKYLHFHVPAVPIFDSIAQDELTRLYRWRPDFQVFPRTDTMEEDYYRYCCRFWRLHADIRVSGAQLTVKLIDFYLTFSSEANRHPANR